MSSERIQKLLAAAGIGSRREVDRWLAEGLISVNGLKVKPGDRASANDKIQLRGKLLHLKAFSEVTPRVIAYHKPAGEIVAHHDPEKRPEVFERLPRLKSSRWVAVGRLDLNTSGLLLLTNDGALANKLMHPSSEVEREYAVRILGEVRKEHLLQLMQGVELEDGMASFDSVAEAGGEGANRWFHVVLREGRNREVRRLWEAMGFQVSRLVRLRYGPVALGRGLRRGKWRDLEPEEFKALYDAAGMEAPVPAQKRKSAQRQKRHRGRR